jgi:hypothetical protein
MLHYLKSFGKEHWETTKCVLRYLNGTSHYYHLRSSRKSKLDIQVYSEALRLRGRSQLPFRYTDNCEQPSTCLENKEIGSSCSSSTDAEYIVLAETTKWAKWAFSVPQGLGYYIKFPIIIHVDNQSSIHNANNNRGTKKKNF